MTVVLIHCFEYITFLSSALQINWRYSYEILFMDKWISIFSLIKALRLLCALDDHTFTHNASFSDTSHWLKKCRLSINLWLNEWSEGKRRNHYSGTSMTKTLLIAYIMGIIIHKSNVLLYSPGTHENISKRGKIFKCTRTAILDKFCTLSHRFWASTEHGSPASRDISDLYNRRTRFFLRCLAAPLVVDWFKK